MKEGLDFETKKMVIGFALAILGIVLLIFAVVISTIIFPIGIPVGLLTAIGGISSAWAGGKMISGQFTGSGSIESPRSRKKRIR
jgi:small neutral amino acid transporter SnatA (MarC family)